MSKGKKTLKDEPPSPEAPAPEAPVAEAAANEPAPPGPEAAEMEALKDRLLRLQADFDNYRKRANRERAELYQRANEELMNELLPVLDHFQLGLAKAVEHKTEKSVHDGFQIVYDQLLGVLKKFGLSPVDVQASVFDPHLHEAVAHVPSDEYAADEIVEQTRRGYKLGDKLLRPIQVVVSSGPGAPRDDEEADGREPKAES